MIHSTWARWYFSTILRYRSQRMTLFVNFYILSINGSSLHYPPITVVSIEFIPNSSLPWVILCLMESLSMSCHNRYIRSKNRRSNYFRWERFKLFFLLIAYQSIPGVWHTQTCVRYSYVRTRKYLDAKRQTTAPPFGYHFPCRCPGFPQNHSKPRDHTNRPE